MKLINIASGNSAWRGLEYYNEHKVNSFNRINENQYEGIIEGNNNKKYNVFMDIEHTRKSKCNCPHAKDKKIICKHIVALYFTIFPEEVENFIKEQEEAEKEYEQYQNDTYDKVVKYIKKMSKSDLQNSLLEILNECPEWIYDRFVRDRIC